MREKGQLVKRGSLSEEGDVEFWDDGTTTARSAHFIPNTTTKVDENAEEGRLTAAPGSEEATAIEAEDTCHTDDGKELPNPTPKL
jgi:protein import protein ZIM17